MLPEVRALTEKYMSNDINLLTEHLKIRTKTDTLPPNVDGLYTRFLQRTFLVLSDDAPDEKIRYLKACAIACKQLGKDHVLFNDDLSDQMDIHTFAHTLLLHNIKKRENETDKTFMIRGGVPEDIVARYQQHTN